MHPIVYEYEGFKIYSYRLLIAIGIIVALNYAVKQSYTKLRIKKSLIYELCLSLIIASFIGGKVFLIFENSQLYFKNPKLLLSNSGFVFYGSFLFSLIVVYFFIKKNQLNTKKFLDIIAIVVCITQFFGRLGCFMSGCCYGTFTNSIIGVTYSDNYCAAPKNISFHPTHLYEMTGVLLILAILWKVKYNQKFDGQLFALYLLLYPFLRFFTEFFRGDISRGYILYNTISISQFISILLLSYGLFIFIKWKYYI